ncbi:hypothetical protein NQ317_013854 [Molorchus minor]|uniref:CCHC-type domain-containing protein n=1 Tax=Molorchus minor TaxID=1323400 RepID=A0ABQ9ISU9_9CUCU|nr:hypothetical protein NQ317_013854 [Molorchus minor]
MSQKIRHRNVLRTSFTKRASELEAFLSQPVVDVTQMRVSWEMLNSKYQDLAEADAEIYANLMSEGAEEDGLAAEMDTCDSYKHTYTLLKLRCEEIETITGLKAEEEQEARTSRQSAVSEQGSTSVTGKRKFKLPAIQFKSFDGNIRDWLSFWSQFQKIHDDPDIDQHDKVEYLIQATAPGSRARRLVESFPAMGANYEKIIDGLKSRFGNEDLQIEVYVRELLKLILSNATSKGKLDISTLYDRIETQIRALETLGITSSKCSAILFPLIESCLPEELIRVWQRSGMTRDITSSNSNEADSSESSLENRLNSLMKFLENEVKNEQRVQLAAEGFGIHSTQTTTGVDSGRKKKNRPVDIGLATATDLINCDGLRCIFCGGTHDSTSCFKSQKFTLEQKRNILSAKKACFRCLKIGHQSKRCNARLRCFVCNKTHVVLMCPELPAHKQTIIVNTSEQTDKPTESATSDQALANNTTSSHVFLQTLLVQVSGQKGSRMVRTLIDTGSQRTYILKSTAQELGCVWKRQERLIHCLFGGVETEQKHDCYEVKLNTNGYTCSLEALDQVKICNDILPACEGPWLEELRELGIQIFDLKHRAPVELLIGADVADAPIANLWELDVLGITEPSEKHSRQERAMAAKEMFTQTVRKDEEGRYEVRLPWLEGHPPLPTNYDLARKRLGATLSKLESQGLSEAYDGIFKEWVQEGIIEQISVTRREDRLVFGVNSSPFLLGATIEHHLTECQKERDYLDSTYKRDLVVKLYKSFYVDNCVTSVDDEDMLKDFIEEASMVMARVKFDLRGWEHTSSKNEPKVSLSVLGLTWRLNEDVLTINKECLREISEIDKKLVTKRQILSIAQRIFDPIGFTCPTMLCPKLLLQKTWATQVGGTWPQEKLDTDEAEINVERKKGLITTLLNTGSEEWHLTYFSKYTKIVRMIAWIFRFIKNLRNKAEKVQGQLTGDEIKSAEIYIYQLIQHESFKGKDDPRLLSLDTFVDAQGIIRLKSRISYREDKDDFRFPIVLAPKHPVRFRSEYLGQLKTTCRKTHCQSISLGEVVLIGSDNEKRLNWPLGRVAELITGKDGQVRLARVDTARGQLLRPVQRIYPLELNNDNSREIAKHLNHYQRNQNDQAECGSYTKSRVSDCDSVEKCGSESKSRASEIVTRSGRRVKIPRKLLDA